MMTSRHDRPDLPTARHRVPHRFSMARAVCVAAVATLAWSASGTNVSAAPNLARTPDALTQAAGLRVGSRGADVTTLQENLVAAGIVVPGGADGVFGPATEGAVRRFQEANALAVTGEVDEATAAALAGGGAPTSSGSVGLAAGVTGDSVEELQRRLSDSGVYVAGGADGIFGPATTKAVTQFQRWNGLTPTGTVDEATAEKLGLGNSSTPPPPAAASAPATDSSNPYVGLAVGARGDRVADLQRALQATGLVVRGGADGIFGPATASALEAFQSVNGIDQTAVLTERGVQILGLGTTTAPEPSPAAPASSEFVGLSNGQRGDAVKRLQQALLDAGVDVRGGADGIFGNATQTALSGYQASVGLATSGVVDVATAEKLGLGSSGTTPQTLATAGASSGNPYVGLSIGAQGDLVRELQNALLSTGLVVSGGADGVFGGATASALKSFQSVNGIDQTGVVTARGAQLLRLGTGEVEVADPIINSGPVTLERFPVQGLCFFGDTWHAARGGGRLHEGVDIIADEGKFLYAVADGEITKLFWDQPGALAGNGIRLTEPDGTYYIYLHMLSFAPGIEVGTKVEAGDVIGFVGNTGSSATAHLHFEIHPGGGAAINPYPHIKAIDDCTNTTKQFQSSFD